MGKLTDVFVGYTAALFVMLTSVLSMATAQMIQGAIPDLQLSVFRLFLQSVLLYIVCKWKDQLTNFKDSDLKWYAVAIVGYLLFNVAGFGAAKCLPLAERGSISSLLIFVGMAILFWIFKTQFPGKIDVSSIAVCVLGIIIVSQPHGFFSKDTGDENYNSLLLELFNFNSNSSNAVWNINDTYCHKHLFHLAQMPYCYFLVVVGSLGQALYFFCLGHKLADVDLSVKLFWVCLGSLLLAIPLMFYLDEINISFFLCLPQALLVLAHSILTCCAIWFTSVALQKLGGLRLSIVLTFSVVMELVFQYTLLEDYQPGKHNVLEVVGVVVVIIGMSFPVITEVVRGKYNGPSYFELEDLTKR